MVVVVIAGVSGVGYIVMVGCLPLAVAAAAAVVVAVVVVGAVVVVVAAVVVSGGVDEAVEVDVGVREATVWEGAKQRNECQTHTHT